MFPDIICPPIQTQFRLNISCPDELKFGAVCEFNCEAGYPLIGGESATCDKTDDDPPQGAWNFGEGNESPFCEGIEAFKTSSVNSRLKID